MADDETLTPEQLQQLAFMSAVVPQPTPFALTADAAGFDTENGYQGFVVVHYQTTFGAFHFFHNNEAVPGYINLLKKRHRESATGGSGLITPNSNGPSGLHIVGGDHD